MVANQSEAGAPVVYGGFWVRFVAVIIDNLIVGAAFSALVIPLFGGDFFDAANFSDPVLADVFGESLFAAVLQALYFITMWTFFGATIGKMTLRLKIVRANDLGPISVGQAVGRYFAQIVSAIPFMLGFIWAAFDPRKQTFHDKLAMTVVTRRELSPAYSPSRL